MTAPDHIPVLLEAFLAACAPQPGERWVDGTFGRGGHTLALLQAGCEVLALDQDAAAAAHAGSLSLQLDESSRQRFHFQRLNFSAMQTAAQTLDWNGVDGVLLDLGVSSPQLDHAERGFSFRMEGPLDMRMDDRQSTTAEHLVNNLPESDLANVLYELGDEYESRRIARAITLERSQRRITTTTQLAEVVARAVPRRAHGRTHAATKTFQALRLAVNQELDCLETVLPLATELLQQGGRLAVISFHSGEDRRVKHFLRERWRPAENSAVPVCFNRVVRCLPDEAEMERNPRARSARLRVGFKGEPEPRARRRV